MKIKPDSLNFKISLIQTVFLILLICLVAVNLPPFFGEIAKIYSSRKVSAYNLVGHKFSGLEKYLEGETIVGYYTNENMEEKDPQKMFSQAQYILAPTILDFGNFNHRYIIFACSTLEEALRKMDEVDAQPLIRNQYNIILAKRKDL